MYSMNIHCFDCHVTYQRTTDIEHTFLEETYSESMRLRYFSYATGLVNMNPQQLIGAPCWSGAWQVCGLNLSVWVETEYLSFNRRREVALLRWSRHPTFILCRSHRRGSVADEITWLMRIHVTHIILV